MFCKYCGREVTNSSRFCPSCGKEQGAPLTPAPAKSALSTRTLLIVAGAVIVVVLLAVLLLRPGQSSEAPQNPGQSQADEAPVVETDPAAALVGTWTNKDGVGLTFTKDGVLKLSGGGLSLGGDTFSYEVTGDNALTLTAEASSVLSLDMEAPYYLLEDTLFIEIGDYSFELTKK